MAKQIEFSPAMPIPRVFDVQGRIQVLRDCLDPKHPLYQPEQQYVNIKAVIKLYEDKKIDGIQEVYIMEGKVVTKEEARNRPGYAYAWREGIPFQYAQKHTYGHGPFGPNFHEAAMERSTE